MAGIFELADEEFIALRNEQHEIRIEARESLKSNLKDIEIDSATIPGVRIELG